MLYVTDIYIYIYIYVYIDKVSVCIGEVMNQLDGT